MINLRTNGIGDSAIKFFQAEQLKDPKLWGKFVDVFRSQPDGKNHGWRGEYWGKMMRGGCLVYEYSQDAELYEILTESVKDMLTTAAEDGRVSSYPREREFLSWDLWCRKYVILACEYYLEICKDKSLKEQVIKFIKGCADYIILRIGNGENQRNINDASGHWLGLNSSSILEPMVKLYNVTHDKKYLDFATYIVNEGGAKNINIFQLAYENKVYPYQYGVAKAYEMISCFEGLLEYYYATKIEWCKIAVINFADAIRKTEISVIGCSGITHELFDYTVARQTVRQNSVLQETCVTVTWMKFCSRVLELTGDSKYADSMEQSFYNAYLGSFNTERNICSFPRTRAADVVDTPLPVDSYSPLLSGVRGVIVGGFQVMPDLTYYGCCNCIAAAGVGVFMKNMVTANKDSITVNFFENGHGTVILDGTEVEITQKTNYPTDGKIEIFVKTAKPVEFELRVRIPEWTGKSGYTVYKKVWFDHKIDLDYPMNIRTQVPVKWEKATVYTDLSNVSSQRYYAGAPVTVCHNPDDDHYIALMRGPITLAADSRSGKEASAVFDFEPTGEICNDNIITDGVPCLLKIRFKDKEGKTFYLVDYASAGKDWKTEIAAWLKTK